MLAKSCGLCCVSHDGNGDDHGVRRANTAREHARWHYLVASHEAPIRSIGRCASRRIFLAAWLSQSPSNPLHCITS